MKPVSSTEGDLLRFAAMNATRINSASPVELRHRAEGRLKGQRIKDSAPLSAIDANRQLHELQVHQIELEMQNEELRNAQAQIEEGLARFTDLYDFSPVGYFTLERGGGIARTNLTGAHLLGMERDRLRGKRFVTFVAEPDQSVFSDFLHRVFMALPDHACEVGLTGKNRPLRTVRIEAMRSSDGQECRAVVMDVTERQQAQEENRRINAELEERVRHRTATIRKLAAELTLTEQRERLRLSHILHEDLQQLVIGAMFLLQSVRGEMTVKDRRQLKKVDKILTQTVEVARTLAVELSPPMLREDGLGAVLRWLGQWMRDNHGLTVTVKVPRKERPLSEALAVILYQTVRELLFNVVKHAKVTAATITLEYLDEQACIVVSDQGVGFDATQQKPFVASPNKFGLFAVCERLALLDGQVNIESTPGQGSRVTLRVPLQMPA